MTARLGELDALKDSFLSKATHDLRNPLSGMLGFVELVLGGYKGPVGPKAREALEAARLNGVALAGIIDNMLDITRLEAGRMTLEPEALDLQAELSSAVEAARREAGAAGVSVELVELGEPIVVRADAGALGKVLGALLTNAVKFTPAGGQAGVSARRGRPREVTVSVSDTGVGIPKERQGKLFTPFFQVPETKNKARPTTGAGLGLALTKGLVEAQGGRLWVESDGERGARFSFTLREEPASPPGASPPAPA
jgi:signal transduction histidine kinase